MHLTIFLHIDHIGSNSSQTTTLPPHRVVITCPSNFQLASIFSSGGFREVCRKPPEGKKLVQSNQAKQEQSQESHLPNGDEHELRDAHQHDMMISSLYKQYQRHLITKTLGRTTKTFHFLYEPWDQHYQT